MNEYKLALLGFGNVGRAFLELLTTKATEIKKRYDILLDLTGIATRSHGIVIDPGGISLSTAQSFVDLKSKTGLAHMDSVEEFLDHCSADIVVEAIPVNYLDGEPALAYLRRALQNGMHVVSANKGPVVHGYPSLTELAKKEKLKYRFESAVMDGAPIFSLWREALPALQLDSFEGILNSTTNYVLMRIEAGESFQEAIASAQQIGIAETDPSGDLEGWDAAVKAAALITVLMEIPALPQQIERVGITHLTESEIRAAADQGKRWKLVCRAKRVGNNFQASVQPEAVDSSSILFQVSGTSSVITFKSDALGDLTIIEKNPGPSTTAYGMLSDVISIATESS
jgi:homoserine dehydrogenase